jgi:hypothetical protein
VGPGVRGALLAFWLLTGASAIRGRGAEASRYQLTDGTLLILLVAELARRARLRRSHLIAICTIGVLIVGANLNVLRHGFDFMDHQTGITEADLGALQIADARAPSDLRLSASVAQDPYMTGITAGRWFAQPRGTEPQPLTRITVAKPGGSAASAAMCPA